MSTPAQRLRGAAGRCRRGAGAGAAPAARWTIPGRTPPSRRSALRYQSFPSGDLIVKNNQWLEDALPGYNDQVDQVRLRRRHQHRVHRRGARLRRDRVQPGRPRPVRAAEHPVPGGVRPRRRRRQRGAGRPQRDRHQRRRRPAGKRVATPFASTAHYSLLAALEQNGLSRHDVQLVDLQPQASLAAWERGDIDAVYTWLPTLDELRKNGKHADHQPAAGHGRQADARPRRGVARRSRTRTRRWSTPGASSRGPGAELIHDDPDAAAKAIAPRSG